MATAGALRAGGWLVVALAMGCRGAAPGSAIGDASAASDSGRTRDSQATSPLPDAPAPTDPSADAGADGAVPADAPGASRATADAEAGGFEDDASGFEDNPCNDPLSASVDVSPDGGVEPNPFTVALAADPFELDGYGELCYTLDAGTPACATFCGTTCAPSSLTYDSTHEIPIGPGVTADGGTVTVRAVCCPGEGDGVQNVTSATFTLAVSPVAFTASTSCPETETLAINGTFDATVCYSFDGTSVSADCTPVAGHVHCFSSGANGMATNVSAGQPAISVSAATTVKTQTCRSGFLGASASQTFTPPSTCP